MIRINQFKIVKSSILIALKLDPVKGLSKVCNLNRASLNLQLKRKRELNSVLQTLQKLKSNNKIKLRILDINKK